MAIPEPKPYIAAFEQLGFGMFVHWGLYSQLGRCEWIYKIDNMEMREYEKLKDTFTADRFDARALARTARDAGCRYIILTTRHHEGFSLYDTRGLSEFDAVHSPAGRDLIAEYVDACREYGLKPFFYHTTLDWHHPDFEGSFDRYLEYLRRSVEVLCRNYGEIGGFWFDGNWSKAGADWKEDELYATIRAWQPNAMIVNNTGLVARGKVGHPEIDSVTFEQGKPVPMNREGMPKYLAAEMCQTVNDHWGIGANDLNYKSPKELIETLCACRQAGANYLLNIGLEAQGSVHPYQRELFALLGRWMSAFGEAIYSGRPYPAGSAGRNFILKSADGSCLYLFALDLGNRGDANVTAGGRCSGSYAFGGVTDRIRSVHWMDNGEELRFAQRDNMLCVDFTGYRYGESYCVRVAKAELEREAT